MCSEIGDGATCAGDLWAIRRDSDRKPREPHQMRPNACELQLSRSCENHVRFVDLNASEPDPSDPESEQPLHLYEVHPGCDPRWRRNRERDHDPRLPHEGHLQSIRSQNGDRPPLPSEQFRGMGPRVPHTALRGPGMGHGPGVVVRVAVATPSILIAGTLGRVPIGARAILRLLLFHGKQPPRYHSALRDCLRPFASSGTVRLASSGSMLARSHVSKQLLRLSPSKLAPAPADLNLRQCYY